MARALDFIIHVWRRRSWIDFTLVKETPMGAGLNLDCFVEVRVAGRDSDFDLVDWRPWVRARVFSFVESWNLTAENNKNQLNISSYV